MPQIVEVPGMGDVEFPDDMSDEQIAAAIKKNMTPQEKPGLGLGRGAGLVGRAIVQGVGSLPLLPLDAGIAAGNLFNRAIGQSELPYMTPRFNQALTDAGLPEPKGMIEKGGSLLVSALTGSRLPAGAAPNEVPKNFQAPAQSLKTEALKKAQSEGYVVPPDSSNPTFMNRLMGGLSGKLKLQQEAASRNQAVTDRLSAVDLKQNPITPLTQGSLSVIRKEAHRAGYEPLRAIGKLKADTKYLDTLDDITKTAQGASKSFPGLKPKAEIDDVIQTLKQKEFDSGDAVDAISHLRELADDAYGSGNRLLGKAYKTASKALEDVIERNLAGKGDDAAGLLKGYRDARQLMAKTYTAAKALSGDSGNFNAHKYASQLGRKPLEGGQKTMADFATMFRKASALQTESFPSISPLDAYGSAIAAGATGSPAPLMIPLTRVGLREYLLSPAGQARAIPKAFDPRTTLGPLGAIPPAAGLLGQ